MRIVLPPYARDPNTGEALPPHPKQREFHALDTKYKFFRGGLGSGKSHAGAQEFLSGILRNYAHFSKLPLKTRKTGLEYHCGAPTYQLLEAPWQHITNLLEEIEIASNFSLEKRRWLSWPRKIELITGDCIRFITLPGKFAGMESAGFFIDEIELAEDPVSAFVTLNNRLRDRRAHRQFGIVTSSPKGDRGISSFWNEKIAQEGAATNYGLVVASTSDNPAHTGSDYVETLKSTMSAREIDENLHGFLICEEGSIFGNEFDSSKSLAWRWRFRKGAPDREYHIAIDMGGNSWHALLIEHNRQHDVDVVFGEVAIDGILDRQFFQRVQTYAKEKFGLLPDDFTNVWIDANPKESRIVSFKFWPGKVRFRIVKNHADKLSGINCVRWRLCDGEGNRRLLFAPSLRATPSPRRVLQSMVNYRWVEKRVDSYLVQTSFTDNHSPFGHSADALRYMIWQKYAHRRIVDLKVA